MKPFERLDAVALPISQENFDTDQILPARYLQKPRANDFGQYLFGNLRFRKDGTEEPGFLLNHAPYRQARIVVAERNFACGSSREHAVWALYDYGFRAVIAPSFGDIFFGNALKNGLLPIVLEPAAAAGLMRAVRAQAGSRVIVDLEAQTVISPDGSTLRFAIDPFAKHCLLNGMDELDYTLGLIPRIEEFERAYDEEAPGAPGSR